MQTILTKTLTTKGLIKKLIREKGIPESMNKYVTQVLFEYKSNLVNGHKEKVKMLFPDLYLYLSEDALSKEICSTIRDYCRRIRELASDNAGLTV